MLVPGYVCGTLVPLKSADKIKGQMKKERRRKIQKERKERERKRRKEHRKTTKTTKKEHS
jgi:hypothetical protein